MSTNVIYLRNEINRSFSKITKFLDRLSALDYYSDNSLKLIGVFKVFIQTLENNLYQIPEEEFWYKTLLSSLNYKITPFIRYVQRSQTNSIPWSILPSFETMVKEILGNNYFLLIRPQWNWNYSVITWDIREYFETILKEFIGDEIEIPSDDRIHIISFPYLDRTNLLYHTIFGHEIGHFIQKDYFNEFLTDELEQNQNIKIIKVVQSQSSGDLFKYSASQLSKLCKEVQEIYHGMLREIIPDIVGYYLFGPSMLFVLHNFALWNNATQLPTSNNNYYPPLKQRIRTLYQLFSKDVNKNSETKDSDCLSSLLKYEKELSVFLEDEYEKDFLSYTIEIKYAVELFKETEEALFEYIYTRLAKYKYKYDPNDIDILVKKLKERVPPNSIENSPVEIADIFLSGWIYYYDRMHNSTNSDYQKEYDLISKLLLKAISNSFIHKEYKKQLNGGS